MRILRWKQGFRALVTCAALLLIFNSLVTLAIRWPQRLPRYASEEPAHVEFQRVSEPGFDSTGRTRLADSAWSMAYFQPDHSDRGHLYVGTNNNILDLSLAVARGEPLEDSALPPEIRRFHPDLGSQRWEAVLDYERVEKAPYRTVGFRIMAIYRTRSDGRSYLYAGTAATKGAGLWRSATGEPGDWHEVFAFDLASEVGSIRGMAVHSDGLLYFSTMPVGDIRPGRGQIWATDGSTFSPVVTEGLGSSGYGITALESFAGCLYAGNYGPTAGFEVWKLRCHDHYDAPPTQVIGGGGGHEYNELAMSLRAFGDHLYVGTGIPLGINPVTRRGPHGCSILRVDSSDQVELVVGRRSEGPLSQYGPGFGWYLNAYCWNMEVHEGYLYLGTWDFSRTLMYLGQHRDLMPPTLRPLVRYLDVSPETWGSPVGGDLYRTRDGLHWDPVVRTGFGNADNHGIRTLESTPMGLFVGTENPFSRLEVWRLLDPTLAGEQTQVGGDQ